MDSNPLLRISALVGAFAACVGCANVMAQTPPTAGAGMAAVTSATAEVSPPTDPLVERRVADKRASDEYQARKQEARKIYSERIKAAKQEEVRKKDADAKALEQATSEQVATQGD